MLGVSSECLCFRGMQLPLSNLDHVCTWCRDDNGTTVYLSMCLWSHTGMPLPVEHEFL